MADLSIPNSFVADADATAEEVNQNFDAIADYINASIASVLADSGTAGRIALVNGSGVPTFTAISGDATLASTGALSLAANSVDSAEIAANAVGASEIGSLPAVRLTKSGNQSISNDSATSITWDTEEFDTDTLHNTGSNTERITATTAGVYLVSAQVVFASNDSGRREMAILPSNGDVVAFAKDDGPSASRDSVLSASGIVKLAAGEYVEVEVFQNRGGALAVQPNVGFGLGSVSQSESYFAAHWLGDG